MRVADRNARCPGGTNPRVALFSCYLLILKEARLAKMATYELAKIVPIKVVALNKLAIQSGGIKRITRLSRIRPKSTNELTVPHSHALDTMLGLLI
jgi:hypothetical protein